LRTACSNPANNPTILGFRLQTPVNEPSLPSTILAFAEELQANLVLHFPTSPFRQFCEIDMNKVVWGLVVLLVILHQDNWLWDNDTLIAGFMPITLLWHAGISLGAAFTWFLATKFAWPVTTEDASTDKGAQA